MHLDRLIDGLDGEKESLVVGFFFPLVVEFRPPEGKCVYVGLYRFFEHFKLGWGVDLVLAQKLELLHPGAPAT